MAFESFIGQDNVKKKLNFYLEAVNNSCGAKAIPFFCFVGAKGLGKTSFAREFSKHIFNSEGQKRTFIEINSSTIKNVGQFFEQIYLPYILDKEVTLLFDEAHALPNNLVMSFLTILNTEMEDIKEFVYKDNSYTFDFTKQSYFFATTESERLFPPFRDRLLTIDFDSYSKSDLSQIYTLNIRNKENLDIKVSDEALELIETSFRGNARNCIQRAKDTILYCQARNKSKLEREDVVNMFDNLGILPHGLTQIEWRILEILRKDGRSSLQALCAKTGLSRSSIQRDHENYLLQKGFMEIDGQRVITRKGQDLLIFKK